MLRIIIFDLYHKLNEIAIYTVMLNYKLSSQYKLVIYLALKGVMYFS